MLTIHLFLYLVDFGTALSAKSSSFSIVFGKRNLPSAMAKPICKSLQAHNAFWNTNLAQRETIYWIIKNKSLQIQWMPTEYNKSQIQGILKWKWGKNTTPHLILYCFFREVISKTGVSCFVTISKHSKIVKHSAEVASCFHLFLSCLEIVIQQSHSFFEMVL